MILAAGWSLKSELLRNEFTYTRDFIRDEAPGQPHRFGCVINFFSWAGGFPYHAATAMFDRYQLAANEIKPPTCLCLPMPLLSDEYVTSFIAISGDWIFHGGGRAGRYTPILYTYAIYAAYDPLPTVRSASDEQWGQRTVTNMGQTE